MTVYKGRRYEVTRYQFGNWRLRLWEPSLIGGYWFYSPRPYITKRGAEKGARRLIDLDDIKSSDEVWI